MNKIEVIAMTGISSLGGIWEGLLAGILVAVPFSCLWVLFIKKNMKKKKLSFLWPLFFVLGFVAGVAALIFIEPYERFVQFMVY